MSTTYGAIQFGIVMSRRVMLLSRRWCEVSPSLHGLKTAPTAAIEDDAEVAITLLEATLRGREQILGPVAHSAVAGRCWPNHELRDDACRNFTATDEQLHTSIRTPKARHSPTRLVA